MITLPSSVRDFDSPETAADMERYLMGLERGRENGGAAATVESLSPEKRALLLERLRKRGGR